MKAVLVSDSLATSAPVLDDRTFAAWREYIRPTAEELAWQQVAWRPSFGEAVEEARRRERPVLLWAMNGHPLACT